MTFGSSYGQTFFVAIFNEEIRNAFELTHGEIGFYYSTATLLSAAVFVWAGGLVDTMSTSRISTIVILCLAGAGFLLSFSDTVVLLLAGFFGLRLAGQGMMTHVALTATAKAFRERRGTALSLVSLGFPIGQATLPIAGVLLIETIGWRTSWAVLSAALLVIILPLALTLLRAAPARAQSGNPKADAGPIKTEENDDSDHWTRARVLKDFSFYLLQPALLAMPIIGTGIIWNITLIADSKSWSLEVIAASLSGLALTQAVMTIVSGPIIDRFRALILLPLSLLPMTACLLILSYATAPFMVFPMMALLGMSFGMVLPVSVAMWAELYGTKHLGAIRSLTQALAVFGTALSPVLMGLMTDWGIQIETTALWLAAYAAIGIILALVVARTGRSALSTH